jgi:hypothetical protein
MSVQLSVPVTITPEAADWVAELGIEETVDRVLAETVHILPGLKALRLTIEPTYDLDEEYPYWLILECHSDHTRDEASDALLAWYGWRAENIPIETGRHFIPDWIGPGDAHAG